MTHLQVVSIASNAYHWHYLLIFLFFFVEKLLNSSIKSFSHPYSIGKLLHKKELIKLLLPRIKGYKSVISFKKYESC